MHKFLRLISLPVAAPLRWAWGVFCDVLRRVMSHGGTGTASQFAYNTFLATVPFMFVVVTAINLSSPTAYDTLFDALEGTIPGITGLTSTFKSSTASGAAAGLVIVVGVMLGLYMASNAIGALVDGLDRAQHLNHRPWWRGKVINFGFAAGASILAVVGTVALAGGERLARGLVDLIGAGDAARELADSLTLPVGVTTLFLFTLLMYRYGPNGIRLSFRVLIPGALLSVGATFGLTKLISMYADAVNNLSAVYGTLGSLFVYLTFLYFTGLMFLVGAELNAEAIHRKLVRASTRDHAQRTAGTAVAAPAEPGEIEQLASPHPPGDLTGATASAGPVTVRDRGAR